MPRPRAAAPPVPRPPSWPIAASIGATALAVYAATMYTSVPGGDAGELVAAAATTGVPHPPGYPLYVLLTKPFLWLPFGEVALRANLASAVAAAGAIALLAWSVARLTAPTAGAAAALVFAFSPTAWLYAAGAEVFSLNTLIVAGELALLVAVDRASTADAAARRRRTRLVHAGALLFGLGLSHHHTSLFLNGVFLAAMLWRVRDDPGWRGLRHWCVVAAWIAAGGLPYVYLPVADARHSIVTWGDTTTLTGFLTHVLRREYGTFESNANLAGGGMSLVTQLGFYVRDVVHQLTWPGVALAAWGLARGGLDRAMRPLAVATATAWALYLLVMHALADLPLDQPLMHGVFARFWLAPNLIVCVWIGWGVARLRLHPRVRAAAAGVLVAAQFAANVRSSHHRDDTIVADYAAAVLRSAPPNALLLTRGDLVTNATRYRVHVNRERPDVRILDMEMLTFRWMAPHVRRHMPDVTIPGTHYNVTGPGAYTLRALIDANIATRPVVICGGTKPGDTSLTGAYRLLPIGLCDRVLPAAQPIDTGAWLSWIAGARPSFRADLHTTTAADSWEREALLASWTARHGVAHATLTAAIERRDDVALLRAAAAEFERLAADRADVPAAVYKNLGIARMRLAATDPASAPLAATAFQTYLRVGPADDPERPAIEEAVRELSRPR